MVVPDPGVESTRKVPPTAASRSAMPCRPVPWVAFAVSKPSPSSVTVNSRWPSGQDRATVAREARAYFGDVLQGLQDAEVRGGLGLPRVAPDAVGLDLDGKRSLARLRVQGGAEPLVGQQRRVDPAGQGAQVIEGGVQPGPELAGDLPDLTGVVGGVLQQGELDVERDELLLGAVVQVPLDPLPLRRPGPAPAAAATPAGRRCGPEVRRSGGRCAAPGPLVTPGAPAACPPRPTSARSSASAG